MAVLRTRSDGTFQVSATELTMDLSNFDVRKEFMKSTRENRRISLIKDEEARIARQLAIEDAVLKRADRIAHGKVEERVWADQVRRQVCPEIPYKTLFKKGPMEREKILDQEIVRREKEHLKEALRPYTDKIAFASARKAIGNAPANQPAAADADAGRQRERISLVDLIDDAPARRPLLNQKLHAPQNPPAVDLIVGPAGKRRNSVA